MGKSRLPPYVARKGDGYRGWAMIAGKRVWGPKRVDPQDAYEDAMRMRRESRALPKRDMVLGDLVTLMAEADRHSLRQDTQDFYAQKWKMIFKVIPENLPLLKVTGPTLQQFVRVMVEGDYSPQTIKHCRTVMRRAFRWAIKKGYTDSDPTTDVSWPEVREKRPDYFRDEEIADYLDAIRRDSPAEFDYVSTQLHTGLRVSEFARLKVGDADLADGILWVEGKRGNVGIPIEDDVRPSVAGLVEASANGHLVPGDTEKARRAFLTNLYRRLKTRFKDTRFHSHAMRHTLATSYARGGTAAPQIQGALRHSDPNMTKRYTHLVANDLRAAQRGLRFIKGGEAEDRDHG